jgi:hypothetical protein
MGEPMRALTVRPPWSWAIAHGAKDVENRSWQPPCWLGTLAIHAGARSRWDRDGEFSLVLRRAWNTWARTRPDAACLLGGPARNSHLVPFGAIVAVAEVSTCHHDGNCYLFPKFDEGTGRCSPWAASGQWHWQLSNVRPLPEPVSCRGALGLWRLPEDVEKAVRSQMEAPR